jgi:hypothetical protein
MRLLGTALMIMGLFSMIAAALEVFEPELRETGISIFAVVTSVPGALIGGAFMIVAGALLRRWGTRRRAARVQQQ